MEKKQNRSQQRHHLHLSESSSTSCYDRAPHNIDSKEIMAFRHQNWQWFGHKIDVDC